MKLLLLVTLSCLSLTACAGSEIIRSSGIQENPIVAQKANASGVSFVSNSDQYQLISGGQAVKKVSSSLSATQTGYSSEVLWKGKNGAFELSITDKTLAQQRAQASSISGSNYNQIAYNPRTGGIGVITGQIIVSYTDNFDAEAIGLSYSMQLVQDFAHLKTAFYTVNSGQDIFLITNSLNQSGLVSNAEVEVIENFAVPM
ncbi:hypothetical protein N8222_09260 [Oceanospirillaceae bacterium]|nr:hypothetical protein [Oceanospirillaceae bacterium]